MAPRKARWLLCVVVMSNLRTKTSTLSNQGANACLDLIETIASINIAKDLDSLWMEIQSVTSATHIITSVYEAEDVKNPAKMSPHTAARFQAGVARGWFEYYQECKVWEHDPLGQACVTRFGQAFSVDECFEMIGNSTTPPEKIEEYKNNLIKFRLNEGLVSVTKAEAIENHYSYVAIGVPKEADAEEFEIIRNIMPHIAWSMARTGLLQTPELSDKELIILELVTKGLSYQAIADDRKITLRTVKFHVASIFSQLQAPNKISAIIKAKKLYGF